MFRINKKEELAQQLEGMLFKNKLNPNAIHYIKLLLPEILADASIRELCNYGLQFKELTHGLFYHSSAKATSEFVEQLLFREESIQRQVDRESFSLMIKSAQIESEEKKIQESEEAVNKVKEEVVSLQVEIRKGLNTYQKIILIPTYIFMTYLWIAPDMVQNIIWSLQEWFPRGDFYKRLHQMDIKIDKSKNDINDFLEEATLRIFSAECFMRRKNSPVAIAGEMRRGRRAALKNKILEHDGAILALNDLRPKILLNIDTFKQDLIQVAREYFAKMLQAQIEQCMKSYLDNFSAIKIKLFTNFTANALDRWEKNLLLQIDDLGRLDLLHKMLFIVKRNCDDLLFCEYKKKLDNIFRDCCQQMEEMQNLEYFARKSDENAMVVFCDRLSGKEISMDIVDVRIGFFCNMALLDPKWYMLFLNSLCSIMNEFDALRNVQEEFPPQKKFTLFGKKSLPKKKAVNPLVENRHAIFIGLIKECEPRLGLMKGTMLSMLADFNSSGQIAGKKIIAASKKSQTIRSFSW